ncbi:unnamed protein product [Malus baccata var. baccata]
MDDGSCEVQNAIEYLNIIGALDENENLIVLDWKRYRLVNSDPQLLYSPETTTKVTTTQKPCSAANKGPSPTVKKAYINSSEKLAFKCSIQF